MGTKKALGRSPALISTCDLDWLELQAETNLRRKRSAHRGTKSRTVERDWLAERACRSRVAQGQSAANVQVFSVEQVIQLSIRLEPDSLTYAEDLGCPEVNVQVAAAPFPDNLAVVVNDKPFSRAVDLDLRAARTIQRLERRRVASSRKHCRQIRTFTNAVNRSSSVTINIEAGVDRVRPRARQLYDRRKLNA